VVFLGLSAVTWLAVVMAVNVAIGLVYYARWLVNIPSRRSRADAYDVPTGSVSRSG
jgi:NADH:ubiquinone oxidoreductase subunit 2 (subunit N)